MGNFNHRQGCQTCGAHPDNPRKHTQKLFACRDCKSITCQRHLGKGRTCPRCAGKRLTIAVRSSGYNLKNTGSAQLGKKGIFGGGGKANVQDPKKAEKAKKAAHLATEIAKGVGVMEALKVLANERDGKRAMPRPEDGPLTLEDLHQKTVMSQGLSEKGGEEASPQKDEPTDQQFGLVMDTDVFNRMAMMAEYTYDEAAFLNSPDKKPKFITDTACFLPSVRDILTISSELLTANASPKTPYKTLCIVHIQVDPSQAEDMDIVYKALDENPYLFASIGLSPKVAGQYELPVWDDFLTNILNKTEKIVAVGPAEINLHYASHTEKEQCALLALQHEIAEDFDLPLVIKHIKGLALLGDFCEEIQRAGSATPLILANPLTSEEGALCEKMGAYALLQAELLDEEAYPTYGKVAQKIGTQRLLLASGDYRFPPKNTPNQRNSPLIVENTLTSSHTLLKNKNIYSLHHQLNLNFLTLFYPEAQKKS